MQKKQHYKVEVTGTGKTTEQAVASALGKIRKKVTEQLKGMIIRIEPLHVEIVEAIEKEEIERFLLLFFPRKKSTFTVTMHVEVQVTILQLEEIHFTKHKK